LGKIDFNGISAFVPLIAGRNTGYGMPDNWSTIQALDGGLIESWVK
jgi:hypothetical protein